MKVFTYLYMLFQNKNLITLELTYVVIESVLFVPTYFSNSFDLCICENAFKLISDAIFYNFYDCVHLTDIY